MYLIECQLFNEIILLIVFPSIKIRILVIERSHALFDRLRVVVTCGVDRRLLFEFDDILVIHCLIFDRFIYLSNINQSFLNQVIILQAY